MGTRWLSPAAIARAAISLGCAALGFVTAMDLIDTEFGGGQLTGVLVRLCLVGSVLLLLCAGLTVVRRGIAAALAGVAAALCLPLFLYRIAPSSLSWLSNAPASVSPSPTPFFDAQAVAGLMALGLLAVAYAASAHRA